MKRSIKTLLAWLLAVVCVFTSIPLSNIKTVQAANDTGMTLEDVFAGMKHLLSELANCSITTGIFPRKHWWDRSPSTGNASGDIRVYRFGVGYTGNSSSLPLIASPYANWSGHEEHKDAHSGISESKLLRLHKAFMAYEQQNWIPVRTSDSAYLVGVVYDENYPGDESAAEAIAKRIREQEGVPVVVGPAKHPGDTNSAGATDNQSNLNCIYRDALENQEFLDLLAETNPYILDRKEYVFNAELVDKLSGMEPVSVARVLGFIGQNEDLSKFDVNIKSELIRILTAGHYTGSHVKAWVGAALLEYTNSRGVKIELHANPTADAMANVSAYLCLYRYFKSIGKTDQAEIYASALSRYFKQVQAAMLAKREDKSMIWTASEFSCLSVEQLVPVNCGSDTFCLSAPELMVAACKGSVKAADIVTIRNTVRKLFAQHASIFVRSDCDTDPKFSATPINGALWKGETLPEIFASMLNWYHSVEHPKCDSGCKLNAHGLQSAIEDSLGVKWQHDSSGALKCTPKVEIKKIDTAVHIVVKGTLTEGKLFLSGITTNSAWSMGGYGALSSTVSHEAKYPKPVVKGSFLIKQINCLPTDTGQIGSTYKTPLNSDDPDQADGPIMIDCVYTFDGKSNKESAVVASLKDAINGCGNKFNEGNVRLGFRVYLKAQAPKNCASFVQPKHETMVSEGFVKNEDVMNMTSANVTTKFNGVTVFKDNGKEVNKTMSDKLSLNLMNAGSHGTGTNRIDYTSYLSEPLTVEQAKALIEGSGSVSWTSTWKPVLGFKKKGQRIFDYRVECDIYYTSDKTRKLDVIDSNDTYDSNGKLTKRFYDYRIIQGSDDGRIKIKVLFKNETEERDCTPPWLANLLFEKKPNEPCIVPKEYGSAIKIVSAYIGVLPDTQFWTDQASVDALYTPKGSPKKELDIPPGAVDIDIKKNYRIGTKSVKGPVATIHLKTDQTWPGGGPGGGPGGDSTSYTVQHYFEGVYDKSYDIVVPAQAIGATITEHAKTDKDLDGYEWEKTEPGGDEYGKTNIKLDKNPANNIIKVYFVETKFKYTSTIAKPYAELKCGSLEQGGSVEPYEAMAGFPTTEDLYFGSGGNETIADVEYEYKRDGKATRKYTFTNKLPAANSQGTSHDLPEVYSYEDTLIPVAKAHFKDWVDSHDMKGAPGANKNGATNWTCAKCGSPFTAANWTHEYHPVRWNWKENSVTSTCKATIPDGVGADNKPKTKLCGQSVTATIGPKLDSAYPDNPVTVTGCHNNRATAAQSPADPTRWSGTYTFHPANDSTTAVLEWTQDAEGFNYNQINKACVWGLTESLVNGTEKLTTEAKIKGSLMDQGAGVRYNVAAANTSLAGRLLYSVDKAQHDDVKWTGTPFADMECCSHCARAHAADHLKKEKNPEGTYNDVTCISDFLMQRTSAGDLSFTYDEYKAGNTSKTALMKKLEFDLTKPDAGDNPKWEIEPITFEDANKDHDRLKIVANDKTFKGINLQPQDMPYCGYSGNFKNTSGKYQTSWSAKTNVNIDDSSLAINDPDYKSTSNVPKPAAVPATVRLGKNAIDVPDMDVRNGHYVLGTSSVYYKRLVAYNRDPSKVSMVYEKDDPENGVKALNQQSNADYDGKEGIVLTTTYSPTHGNINDVVVHDPVTCQYSMFFNTEGARDQRVDAEVVADTPEVATCPGIAIDCPYSHLDCSYNKNNGSVVHGKDCFLNDYDYWHQSNPVCNNPHHQNSRNIRYYLWGWRNSDDYSEYEYRSGTDDNEYFASYMDDAATPANLCSKVYIAQNALTESYCLVSRGSVTGSPTSNGEGGYTATGQVTAVDSLTGATFNVSTYNDGTKSVLCLWDPVCDTEVPLFNGAKLKNPIFHEPEGDATCWKACMNPAKHQKNPSVTVDGKTYNRNPKFLNLDREFYLYFPNTGDFRGDDAYGIDKVQQAEGKGYTDSMDTTTWVQNKYCVFDFDVIYDIDGNPNTTNDCICYKAGEKVILGTFKPETKANGTKTGKFIDDGENTGYKYLFYVPLENHEMANAQIHCYAVGLNAGTDTWVENFGTHNYERNDTYYAYHDASKDTTLDLIGQIGGLTLMDTGDFRFSETFKQPLNEWLIKNLVKKVDYRKQNYVIADLLDIRGNNYLAITNSALNTYGTQWYKETHEKILPFPLTPAKNVNTALRKQPLRPGYATYLSLETIGDYYGEEVNSDTSRKVQIRPLYYQLNLTTGKFTQLDVYMLDNGLYKCINKFDSNEPVTEHEWPYYFNWEGEKDRRMVTVSEEAITKKVEPALTFVNKCTINAETGLAETVTGKAIIPKGTHYKFGNAQMLHLRARNRTFVGTDYTNKVWHNGRVGSADVQDPKVRLNVVSYPALQSPSRPAIFDEIEYNARGQHWHFSLGLPSSTVFVEKGKDPVQEEIEKVSNDHSVIVVALDVKAKGDVWTLQYNGIPTEGQKIQILPNGPVYDYAPDPDGPKDKPIVEVYTSKFSAKDDLSVEGTH